MTNTQSNRRKAIIAIFIISFVAAMNTLSTALLAYIMASYPDASPSMVMQILTLPSLVAIFVTFAMGPLAMKFKTKNLLIISFLCSLTFFVIFAFWGGTASLTVLLVAAGISGLNLGSSLTLINLLIGEHIEPEKQATYISIANALMNGGAALMGILGGVIASANNGANWQNAYFLGFLIIPALLAFMILMPSDPPKQPMEASEAVVEDNESKLSKLKLIPGKVWLIMAVMFVNITAYMGYMLNLSSYIITDYQLGSSIEAGIANTLCTLSGLVIGFSYPIWEKLLKKYFILVSFVLFGTAFLIMALVNTTIAGVFVGSILLGLGYNAIYPPLMAATMNLTPPRYVPIAMSLMLGLGNLGSFMAPFILTGIGSLFGGGITGQLFASLICVIASTAICVFVFIIGKTEPTDEMVIEAAVETSSDVDQ